MKVRKPDCRFWFPLWGLGGQKSDNLGGCSKMCVCHKIQILSYGNKKTTYYPATNSRAFSSADSEGGFCDSITAILRIRSSWFSSRTFVIVRAASS